MDIGSVSQAYRAGLNETHTPAQTGPPPEVTKERQNLIQAVKAVNETGFFGQDNEVTFALDRESGRPLIRVVNRKTHEVVRQLPTEDTLRLAKDLTAKRR